jgi:uncharacterized integral membrane protein
MHLEVFCGLLPARGLISYGGSMYRTGMHHVRTAFVIFILFIVIIFCVNNSESYSLSFVGYHLAVRLQLWMLMVAFFIAGMVPILLSELPRTVAHFSRMRSLKAQIRKMEAELEGGATSPEDPLK